MTDVVAFTAPPDCSTFATTVAASTAPPSTSSVPAFSSVVASMSAPVSAFTTVTPASIAFAEILPFTSAPPPSVSVPAATSPAVCVNLPVSFRSEVCASSLPPDCSVAPVTSAVFTSPLTSVSLPSTFAVSSVEPSPSTVTSPVTDVVAFTAPPDCSTFATMVAASTLPASTSSVPAFSSPVTVTAAPSAVSVVVTAATQPAFTVPFTVEAAPSFSVLAPASTLKSSIVSPAFSAMSPSVDVIEPAEVILPDASARTDLPCRYLPEATDICLCVTTTSEIGSPAWNSIAPSALTAPFTKMLPSVTAVRSPATFTGAPSPSANVTLMSSPASAKSAILMFTLPPATSSTFSLPPAATVRLPPNSAPSATVTARPMSAASPVNFAPEATSTLPCITPRTGVGIAEPDSIAAKMSSLLARSDAATENSPPTLTFAPFMNETPAGLNTQSWPFAVSVPAICEALPPETTLKNCAPEKDIDCPAPTFSACQSMSPALPPFNPICAAVRSVLKVTLPVAVL